MLTSFIRQLYLAITDFEFYPKIFEQPFRQTLLFLLLLCASLSTLLTVIYAWQYSPDVDRFFAWAHDSLPAFEVKDGELLLDGNEPIVTTYRDEQRWTFVFDTGGTYTDTSGLEEPAFLFKKEELLFRIQGQTQAYAWKEFGDFAVNPDNLSSYRALLTWLYFPVAYTILLLFTVFAKLVTGLLLCPLAYSVGMTYGARLSLKNCLTICLYCLVPATAIDLAVQMTGLNISYFEIFYLAAAAIYTFFATQRCAMAH